MTERPTYNESAPAPDERAPPELIDLQVFQNSTVKLSFNMKMKFKDDEKLATRIDAWLNQHILVAKVKAGVDGSTYEANSDRVTEEGPAPAPVVESAVKQTPEERRAALVAELKARYYWAEPRHRAIVEVFCDSPTTALYAVERLELATRDLSLAEQRSFLDTLQLSRTQSDAVAARLGGRRRLAHVHGGHRAAVGADELDFRFSFLSLDTTELWMLLRFEDFKGVSKADTRD